MEKIEGKVNEPVANCDQLPKAIDIQPMIRVIRGQQVIIDRDLALLYGVETKRLNEQVNKRLCWILIWRRCTVLKLNI